MKNITETNAYQKFYLKEYGFESEMVRARQQVILELLKKYKPRRVLEIGCGPVLLYDKACRERLPISQWAVVEPCKIFTRRIQPQRIPVWIFSGFFEKESRRIVAAFPEKFDFVICSGMLNEVRRPVPFLRQVKNMLTPKGILHINVPNAGSLHRRLGKAMGLTSRLAQRSHRNRELLQYHVFDQEMLQAMVHRSGMTLLESGGYFLKPFSHAQMAAIGPKVLTRRVLDGLWQLGCEYPEFATEVYANVRMR